MSTDFVENTNIKQYEKLIESEMDKNIKHFEKELSKISTGRAHPSMVEDIRVSCYGTYMPIKEIASVTAPEASLLVIQPWDKSVISDIEKGIATSDLSVTPQNNGELIRIKIPPMSSSRRDELTKVLNQKLELAKVSVRHIRQDTQNKIRQAQKAKDISEDYSKKLQDTLQKITDKFIKLTESIADKKEAEIKNL